VKSYKGPLIAFSILLVLAFAELIWKLTPKVGVVGPHVVEFQDAFWAFVWRLAFACILTLPWVLKIRRKLKHTNDSTKKNESQQIE